MSLSPKSPRISPIIKYPGGKERELKFILPALPADARNYYDPFVGGGAVYLSVDAEQYYINDLSEELMLLYSCARERDQYFFAGLEAVCECWEFLTQAAVDNKYELVGLYQYCARPQVMEAGIQAPIMDFLDKLKTTPSPLFNESCMLFCWWHSEDWYNELLRSFENKFKRMVELESKKGMLSMEDCFQNMETCLKNAFYMYLRGMYNHKTDIELKDGERAALYFFIREYCYSSMFRYNSKGEFNVPYGGISYNRKSPRAKVESLKSQEFLDHVDKTIVGCEDFLEFMRKYPPSSEDFVFLDPPYDTTFSTYDGKAFARDDQKRLADYICDECEASFLLVIKDTELIRELYSEGRMTRNGRPLSVYSFDKNYHVSFMNRNDKASEHLMISNYPLFDMLDLRVEQ